MEMSDFYEGMEKMFGPGSADPTLRDLVSALDRLAGTLSELGAVREKIRQVL